MVTAILSRWKLSIFISQLKVAYTVRLLITGGDFMIAEPWTFNDIFKWWCVLANILPNIFFYPLPHWHWFWTTVIFSLQTSLILYQNYRRIFILHLSMLLKNTWLHEDQFWWTASVFFRFIDQISLIIMIVDLSR